MNDKFDIFNLPDRLFKYYGYDSKLNAKRLAGEIYLACPYDFNDPCDCQREVINNSQDRVAAKGKDWLKRKMRELDFNTSDSLDIANSLLVDDSKVKQVHKRMLERLGILCLTSSHADSLMWGYYTNNDGICIEYDRDKIVRNLVIGYINKMSYTTTRFLYEEEKYYQEPKQRTPSLKELHISLAENTIRQKDIKQITNKYLEEGEIDFQILNFARNILLKRIYAQSIIYNISPDGSPAPLFFERGHTSSGAKYFKKTSTWKHENEFRFIVSLGGRIPINIGKDCIKNVYLGCNMSNEIVAAIAYLMVKNNLSAGLYKMTRLKNGGLKAQGIKWGNYKNSMEKLEQELKGKFPED